MSELSEAVSALVDIRPVVTDQEPGEAHQGGIHVESLPSLWELLVDGTGPTRGSGGSGIGAPIDADALEMWAQIRDRVSEWCHNARVPFRRDEVPGSMRAWVSYVDGNPSIPDELYHDYVRQVDTWCAWVEAKYDPDEKREGTTPCPKCGVLKVTSADLDEPEQFAIELNITKNYAACRNPLCDYTQRIPEWRFESNIAGRTDLEPDALKVLVERETTNHNM